MVNQKPSKPDPGEIKIRQQIFADGIRYSILMISFAYKRLCELLTLMSDKRGDININHFTSVFLDTWFIIDASYRLRQLLVSTPGIKQNTIPIRLFLDRTNTLGNLRNYIQHPYTSKEIDELLRDKQPFWGSIAWFRVYDQDKGRVCTLRAGALYKEENIPFVNPAGKTVTPPVDLIELSIGDKHISISNLMNAINDLRKEVQQQLSTKSDLTLPGTMADIFTSMDWDSSPRTTDPKLSKVP